MTPTVTTVRLGAHDSSLCQEAQEESRQCHRSEGGEEGGVFQGINGEERSNSASWRQGLLKSEGKSPREHGDLPVLYDVENVDHCTVIFLFIKND